MGMVFNGLARYRLGNITVFKLDLAESREVSSDGLVWTVHLRHGMMVHPYPGNPESYELTSEDVVLSLEKGANSKTSCLCRGIRGYAFPSRGQVHGEDHARSTPFSKPVLA